MGQSQPRILRTTDVCSSYIRYFLFAKHGCSLEFNPNLWMKFMPTPLWLGIKSETWKYDAEARNKLARFEYEEPKRLFQVGDNLYIPLFMPTMKEKNEVVEQVLNQVKEVMRLLEK